jgi:SWI/SNF-related matrix-associated actin-dependent regulator of chromatin subfamily B member 1
MREAFVWNLNGGNPSLCRFVCILRAVKDPVITPEIFAQSLVDDYALAPNYLSVIVKSIQDQLSDFQAHTTDFAPDNEAESLLQGRLDQKEKAWWDKWRRELPSIAKRPKEALVTGRKRRKVDVHVKAERDPDAPATVADIEVDEKEQQEEMRILIRVRSALRIIFREANAHMP